MIQKLVAILTVLTLWLVYFLVYLPTTKDSIYVEAYVGILVFTATYCGVKIIRIKNKDNK
ncbi:TPA: hypothetical protein DF272_05930 [Candidatus Falkowbacteria bacterium]|nr:hypothetical protein [Candidatus Falkowbacteria bacterium]